MWRDMRKKEEEGRAPIDPEECPKCGTRMIIEEFHDADGKEMSEGKLAEHLAGTYGSIICPKCGYSEDFEI